MLNFKWPLQEALRGCCLLGLAVNSRLSLPELAIWGLNMGSSSQNENICIMATCPIPWGDFISCSLKSIHSSSSHLITFYLYGSKSRQEVLKVLCIIRPYSNSNNQKTLYAQALGSSEKEKLPFNKKKLWVESGSVNQPETQVSHKYHTGSYKKLHSATCWTDGWDGELSKEAKNIFVPGCNNMLISILLSRTINIVVGLVKMVVA